MSIKKQDKVKNLTIVIFPYLFLTKEFTIDGITIKPSFKNIVEKEEPEIRNQLLRIATFFRYDYDKQINSWCFHIAYLRN
ncbi:MAG: hypothetical protein AB1442_14755, partial [Nitrospirota bacterium]